MATVTFDTLKFANQLKTAGVPVGHAEAEAKALSEIFETSLSELATKEDLRHEIRELDTGLRHEMKELETGLRHEMGDLRKDLQHVEERFDTKLANLKFELLKWLIGLAVAQTGLLIGFLKFFALG